MKTNLDKLWLFRVCICLLFCQCLIVACRNSDHVNKKDANSVSRIVELTEIQKAGFEAFDSIQLKIKGHHLYSTFSGLNRNCTTSDTSFIISQADLLVAIKKLLRTYETGYTLERSTELATIGVLIKDEYRVEQCYSRSMQMVEGALTSVPIQSRFQGVWIITKVLGRRDIVIEW